MFKAAIFDLNGTVLYDENLWDEAFIFVLGEYGIEADECAHVPGIGIVNNWLQLKKQHQSISNIETSSLRQKTMEHYLDCMRERGIYRKGYKEFIKLVLP